jgi:DNA primase
MARIPEDELERLKSEVSVQRLVEASGIELKKGGKDLVGRCPFHSPDTEPSLRITPSKNLWHCFGCGQAGGPIDWVVKTRGLSFRHAVELLMADPSLAAGAPRKVTTTRALPPPVALDADDQALLAQTVDYYHQRIKGHADALAYLKSRGLDHPGVIDTFKLGVADRTLGLRLPMKNRAEGAAIRERLQRLGVIRESGHEHFNGSLVVPVFDAAGQVAEIYGRKIRDDLREGTAKHLYLPGPHVGVFNLAGVQQAGQRPAGEREVILCEALIDALTCWVHGYTHVTSSFGVEGFTDDILAAFKANHIERVLIAYDRDAAGERAAEKLAVQLIAEGFEVLRVLLPKGMDVNEFAQKMSPPAKALALALRQAQWIGGARRPSEGEDGEGSAPVAPVHKPPPVAPASTATAPQEQPAAKEETQAHPSLAADPARATPPTEGEGTLADEVLLQAQACSWRIRGWKKNTTPEAMRVNLQVRSQAGYFVDTLDLYAARSRTAFVRQASVELALGEDVVKRELGEVLLKLEGLQDELMAQARRPTTPTAPVLSAEDEAAALALLRTPNLMQRIVEDLHALGVVGEDMNLMAAYLAAVSRKLDAPLAVLIQSTSAAGKSALMDAVLNLVPPEERIRYSAMTGQSLYYLGENNLSHKILAIAEEEGVRQAAYALKLLQSDGELTIASTAKDEATGNLATREYTVRGPVMLMLTTTAIDVDEELLNRCLVLSVNESREQTQAIHARQRQKQTLEGLLQRAGREQLQALHHNAQRLLANVAVVNPYANELTFLADKTRTRRDHMKYLTLIQAIALLHQHQREVKSAEHAGGQLAYIEVTREDIQLANQVAHEVLGRTLDEMPPQTRKLLRLIGALVDERAKSQRVHAAQVRFTRRDVREATGWSDNQLKVHCARLTEMEYLLVHVGGRGHSLRYELLWDGEGGGDEDAKRLCGLIDVHDLPLRLPQVGVAGAQVGAKLASSWAQVGVKLDALETLPARADAGAVPAKGLNGAQPHNKAGGAGASSGVVHP